MPSVLESRNMLIMAEPFVEFTRHMEIVFPHLEWDLKRSGFTINVAQYLAVSIYVTVAVLIMTLLATVVPFMLTGAIEKAYPGMVFCLIMTVLALVYMVFLPKLKINQRGRLIDRDLEYVLKDIQIQLTAGVPLFDTFVNIARGEYGECSIISKGIIREVEAGKAMGDVLDDVGMWSPSEFLRKSLWQIVNALRSGSDVAEALEVISKEIRLDKENRIKSYSKELNLWGLIYMMVAVILPSMGVTLMVILSSFFGEGIITEQRFWLILFFLMVFQVLFISFVNQKRPII
ncbi:MAG: hypothetical protein GF334_00405, partial [Candidatus Altiarchaeales archaeon]|nr:hypothetical protein [Candidatus Altiarchaeales archaeon]